MWNLGTIILSILLVTTAVCGRTRMLPAMSHTDKAQVEQLDPKDVVRSPKKDKEGFVVRHVDSNELWLNTVATQSRKLVKRFDAETGIRNLLWAPDGETLAFETYNLAGHSPLTTFHVWVVKYDSATAKEIRLPFPNEAMSTLIEKWKSSNALFIRATTSDSVIDVIYVYDLSTEKLTKPN